MNRANRLYCVIAAGLLFLSRPLPAQELDPSQMPMTAPAGTEPSAPNNGEPETTNGAMKKVDLNPREVAVWSMVGVSGAALVTAGVFGLTSLDADSRYEENSESVYKNRRDERMTASVVLFGVAGAAAITAISLWYTDKKRQKKHPALAEDPVISAAIGPDGAVFRTTF